MTHPSDRIRASKSSLLRGKTVVLAVSGSIAAVEAVKLARELVRHGADVVPVMSDASSRILHPDALQFATGHAPLLTLTGAVEHVDLCGEGGRADVLLVAPATANTIGKMALGIDDTPVTTFATTAIGAGKPVVVAPAMHGVMHDNPAVEGNLVKLRSMGVTVLEPLFEEDKAKLSSLELVVDAVIREVRGRPLAGLKAVVVTGGSREALDDVRVVTNRSSGALGLALARALWLDGADVEVLRGSTEVAHPPHLAGRRFGSVEEVLPLLEPLAASKPGLVVMAAALGDFAPERAAGKLASGRSRDVTLRPVPKVLDALPALFPHATLLSFKLEATLAEAEREAAKRVAAAADSAGSRGARGSRPAAAGAHWVFANGAETLGAGDVNGVLLGPGGLRVPLSGPKSDVAFAVVENLLPHLGGGRR